jgi:amino acid permease
MGLSAARTMAADEEDILKYPTPISTDIAGDTAKDVPNRDVSGDVIEDGLRRGLKGRQFVIIALGSIIGPGCLYGLGLGFYASGPLGVLVCFVITGISMWILMQSVGEVATLFPVHGGFVEVSLSMYLCFSIPITVSHSKMHLCANSLCSSCGIGF